MLNEKPVVTYVRVSTPAQVSTGRSLEDQTASVRRFTLGNGLEIVQEYRDEGVSGHTLERPALKELRALLRSGAAKTLVVSHIDRLTRSGLDLQELLDEFDGLGVRLVTTEDRIADQIGLDSVRDVVAMRLVVSFAQWQRDRISDATKRAHAALRAQGKAVNRDLYGFDRDTAGDLVPNEAELHVLARILDLNRSGVSASAIARKLNNEGLRGKRGGRWQAKTVLSKLEHLAAPPYRDLYEQLLPALDAE